MAEVQTPPAGETPGQRWNYEDGEAYAGLNWTDGANVWRKVVPLGNLPNGAQANIPHGVIDYNRFIRIFGFATRDDNVLHLPLPFVHNNPDRSIRLLVNGPDIVVDTGTANRSNFTATVILLYTKT